MRFMVNQIHERIKVTPFMKKIISILLAILVVLSIAACSEKNTNDSYTDELNLSNENIVLYIDCKAAQMKNYDSIASLCTDADFVFQGEVVAHESDVFDAAGTVLTDYEFKIENILINNINYNESSISIREPGGIVAYKYYSKFVSDEKDFDQGESSINQEDYENGMVKFTYNSAPLLKEGGTYIIFAKKYTENGEPEYFIVGNYQGTFWENETGGKIERYNLDSVEDNISGMTINTFEKSIETVNNQIK